MDQLQRQQCLVEGHKDSILFFICTDLKCKEKNKFGCFYCMKNNHNECGIGKQISINEIQQKEEKIYPLVFLEIEKFLQENKDHENLYQEGIDTISQEFEKIKETFLQMLKEKQIYLLNIWKEKTAQIQKIQQFQAKFEQIDMQKDIIKTIHDNQTNYEKLQNEISQLVQKYHKKEGDDQNFKQIFSDYRQIQKETLFSGVLIKDLKERQESLFIGLKESLEQYIFSFQIYDIQNFSIIKNLDELEFIIKGLRQQMKDEKFDFQLIFDTEKDGFTSQKFHEKCDLKNNLLVVVQSHEGQRFGGFTSLAFDTQSKNGHYSPNGFNFLFNLNNLKMYSQNDNIYSIYQNTGYGPTFGAGNGHDLYISNNCNQNFSSYSNLPSAFGKNDGAKQFELSKNQTFVVVRYQVFRFDTIKQY